MKFLGCLEAKIAKVISFMTAILNVQYGGHAGVCANANIDFWIPHVLNFKKMYCFANLHKFPTKVYFVT